ncbi:unnamed protein product [Cercospora beticola]|nr:unnamed protein product [Cercospora beticola]
MKLVIFTTSAILFYSRLTYGWSIGDKCCPRTVHSCVSNHYDGCVKAANDESCVEENSDPDCLTQCLMHSGIETRDLKLYKRADGAFPQCICASFDSKSSKDCPTS